MVLTDFESRLNDKLFVLNGHKIKGYFELVKEDCELGESVKKRKKAEKMAVEIAGVKLYTAQSIADTFGINVVTILRHIKKRNLKARLIGHKYYITEENLRIFLSMPKKK